MKSKSIIFSILCIFTSFVPNSLAQAINLPDLAFTQFTIERLEWRQMPDCEHNACQNLVWKAVIDFNFTVQNQGQITAEGPNGNWETSTIQETLIFKQNNTVVAEQPNAISILNPLAPGASQQMRGRFYLQEGVRLKPQSLYTICLNITGKLSDPQNQNWRLQESNYNNNKICKDFVLDIPAQHLLPNPAASDVQVPLVIGRNPDRTLDFQVQYGVKNTVKQVYSESIPVRVELIGNGMNLILCNRNIGPGLHGQEVRQDSCNVHLVPAIQPGQYKIRVHLDPTNRLAESNERDNIKDTAIQIL